ncbi:MAG: hypothetical protein LLG05_07070, partial [Porphyromonadaceae bacterium]|nr:hypothetical protein [Porphyromonadaceae bacterium]
AVLLICTSAFANFKIILKNGREFIVEDYKEINGKIKFYRSGGEVELDKNMIESIKDTKKSLPEDNIPSAIIDETEQKTTPQNDKEKNYDDPKNKLEEITKKKEALKLKQEQLKSEQNKLNEEMKKEGRLTSIRKSREFEQRAKELKDKIQKYDDEILSIQKEEQKILQESSSKQK